MIQKVVAAGCVLLAPVLFWQAASNAGVASAASWNGFQMVKLARASLQYTSEEGTPVQLSAPPLAIALAAKGYASEPLATNGLVILAQSKEIAQDSNRSALLIEKTVQLHKRDKLAQAMAIQTALERSDYARAFDRIDDLAAMRSETIGPVVAALHPLLGTAEGRSFVSEALTEGPRWSDQFWTNVPTVDAQFAGYLILLEELQPKLSDEAVASLVGNFVRRGRVQEAHALAMEEFGEAIDQYWFVDSPDLAPIGWDLAKGANASVTALEDRSYEFFVARAETSVLAKQIVALPPGEYRVDADVDPVSLSEILNVRLTCADGSPTTLGRQNVSFGERFSVSQECATYQLEIIGDAWEAQTDVRGTIRKLRLVAS